MTVNEIKKALEKQECVNCSIGCEGYKTSLDCVVGLSKQALDLINQYEEEIEKNENIIRLADKAIKTANAENKRLSVLAELGNMRANDYRTMRDKCNTIKAEAIKEFAKRLKESIKKSVDDAWHSDGNGIYDAECVLEDIDNLLKEMGVE